MRDHIEKVVESEVGENLDGVSVIKILDHPSCERYNFFNIISSCCFIYKMIWLLFSDDRIFMQYHNSLSDALTRLAQAIYAVLSREYFSIAADAIVLST